jgi:glucose-6-phosphate 1-epimerase
MHADALNERFAIPGHLIFEDHGELVRAQITLPACTATIYLHGAHLTHWQPAGEQPVIFLSERTGLAPDKPIRGGIPICFPWFGPRGDGLPGPTHGFARTTEWELQFAALIPGDSPRLHLTLTLPPTEQSRALGFGDLRAALEISLGTELGMHFSAVNTGDTAIRIEEALHTYFSVGDVRATTLTGLESARYLDKTDGFREKTNPPGPMPILGWTDHVYAGSASATTIHDAVAGRAIHIEKTNSHTTVVWNPSADGSTGMSDLGPEEWRRFLCVEAANTGSDAVMLAPQEAHTLGLTITVERA